MLYEAQSQSLIHVIFAGCSPCSRSTSCAGELNPITLQPFAHVAPPRVLRPLPLNCSAPGALQGGRSRAKAKASGELLEKEFLKINTYVS